jgi:hypothetical protein
MSAILDRTPGADFPLPAKSYPEQTTGFAPPSRRSRAGALNAKAAISGNQVFRTQEFCTGNAGASTRKIGPSKRRTPD